MQSISRLISYLEQSVFESEYLIESIWSNASAQYDMNIACRRNILVRGFSQFIITRTSPRSWGWLAFFNKIINKSGPVHLLASWEWLPERCCLIFPWKWELFGAIDKCLQYMKLKESSTVQYALFSLPARTTYAVWRTSQSASER